MGNLQIPDWDTFDNQDAFPYQIENINGFSLVAAFPAISNWDDPLFRSKLQDRLHDDITKLLRTAEFFSEGNLEQRKAADYFSIYYEDDIYSFTIACYHDRLVVKKHGIKLKTFHKWYFSAVPGFKQLFSSLLSVMSKELGREQTITSVYYEFQFITYDFIERGKSLRNYTVLSKLTTQVPDESGSIQEMSSEQRNITRWDYKVHCWDFLNNQERRKLTYSVTAPSNQQFSGLWFEFTYGSETFTDPDTGKREWIDPQMLLDEFERAYDFMWHKASKGFISSLLRQVSFKSTATYIP